MPDVTSPEVPLSQAVAGMVVRQRCAGVPAHAQYACARGSLLNVETIQPAIERPAAHSEQPGGGRFVPADLLQHSLDLFALRRREQVRDPTALRYG